jgi:hypothetical protein
MGNGAQTKQERSKVTHPTREDWLTAAIASLRPVFAGHGLSLPARIRATCGLPSTFSRSGTLAECWADTDSADQTHEVMVSPTLADPAQVLAQLVGALAHAAPGAMSHTSNAYIEAAANLGLCPAGDNWRMVAGAEDFAAQYAQVLQTLGTYPHAALNVGVKKTQSTRMLKATCPACGYTVRLSAKWAALGLPTCPTDGDTFALESQIAAAEEV